MKLDMESEYKRAIGKALVLVGHSDRTAYELTNRLIQNGFSEEIVQQVTEFLIDERYIDDNRYAQYYVVCYQGKRSVARIRRELLTKGIDKSIVDDVLCECDDAEAFDKALQKQLRKRNVSDISQADFATRKKIAEALYRQGFSTTLFQSYLTDRDIR